MARNLKESSLEKSIHDLQQELIKANNELKLSEQYRILAEKYAQDNLKLKERIERLEKELKEIKSPPDGIIDELRGSQNIIELRRVNGILSGQIHNLKAQNESLKANIDKLRTIVSGKRARGFGFDAFERPNVFNDRPAASKELQERNEELRKMLSKCEV